MLILLLNGAMNHSKVFQELKSLILMGLEFIGKYVKCGKRKLEWWVGCKVRFLDWNISANWTFFPFIYWCTEITR